MLFQHALATICVVLASLINPLWAHPHSAIYHVTEGQSIQAAIRNAGDRDKIIVEKGTYREQLTISINGLTLEGHDATLNSTGAPDVTNTCTGLVGDGLQAGICVEGSEIVFSNDPINGEHRKVISVSEPAEDTHISGFAVTGFSGLNIAVLGAKEAHIHDNKVSAAPQYGILTVGSKNSHIRHNTVFNTPDYTNQFIGICMDDMSTVTISHNDIADVFVGLCVQTSGAHIYNNNVHDTCVGAFVDPGIDGAKLHDNTFSNTPSACPATIPNQTPPFPPRYFAAGVTISGAINTEVKNNKFFKITNSETLAVGVIIVDDPTGAIASGNEIEKNTFEKNDLDVYDIVSGKGNEVKNNACTSSIPDHLCS
jgi:nitrous oxidase accessory protein NosD